MPAAERFTVEEKLAALHELREAVRVLLDDARERAAEGGAAGTGRGAELSRRDARSYEAQLAVLAEAEAALLAGRPRGIGARAGNLPVDGRHGAGPAGAAKPAAAERPSAAPRGATAGR